MVRKYWRVRVIITGRSIVSGPSDIKLKVNQSNIQLGEGCKINEQKKETADSSALVEKMLVTARQTLSEKKKK